MPCSRTQQANFSACSPKLPLNAERQSGKLWIPFLKSFLMARQGNKPQVYRLRSGRYNHSPIPAYPKITNKLYDNQMITKKKSLYLTSSKIFKGLVLNLHKTKNSLPNFWQNHGVWSSLPKTKRFLLKKHQRSSKISVTNK